MATVLAEALSCIAAKSRCSDGQKLKSCGICCSLHLESKHSISGALPDLCVMLHTAFTSSNSCCALRISFPPACDALLCIDFLLPRGAKLAESAWHTRFVCLGELCGIGTAYDAILGLSRRARIRGLRKNPYFAPNIYSVCTCGTVDEGVKSKLSVYMAKAAEVVICGKIIAMNSHTGLTPPDTRPYDAHREQPTKASELLFL